MDGLRVEKRVPRPHRQVHVGHAHIRSIHSGTQSPSVKQGIALARIHRKYSKIGTKVEIDIRGKRATAEVVRGAFYKRDY